MCCFQLHSLSGDSCNGVRGVIVGSFFVTNIYISIPHYCVPDSFGIKPSGGYTAIGEAIKRGTKLLSQQDNGHEKVNTHTHHAHSRLLLLSSSKRLIIFFC